MSTLTTDPAGSPPDWVIRQMPPGYRTRLGEIERLVGELRDMDRFARLLWEVGVPLEEAVRDTFAAMKLDIEPSPAAGTRQIAVRLKGGRRLIVEVADADAVVQKKGAAVERVFHLLQKVAGDSDRVVLIATCGTDRPPAERPALVDPDALSLLKRLGVNVMSGPTMFALWSVALQDPERARTYIERLHEQDGGLYQPPST